jgi:gliding motility associated protien GldN
MKRLSLLLSVLFISGMAYAQTEFYSETGYHIASLKQIHDSDQMYRKTVIRAMDLREPQNKPVFARNHEMPRLFIEAVRAGKLTPYENDSIMLSKKVPLEEFEKRLLLPSADDGTDGDDDPFGGGWDVGGFGDDFGGAEEEEEEISNTFFPRDLYQMEIKEDVIFDKQRSVLYYDIIALTIFVPADHPENIRGIQMPIASFSYKEVVENVFDGNPDAVWINPKNDRHHHTLTDAFELRLFSSYIIKVSNPDDAYLVDIYGGNQKTGIFASQWAAFELMEYEHNLWEF